ncbi:GMC family oxidoreductase [Bradyrhizobium sp. Arg62]|uniref:GMC oxidoreductase n=1 Tax=Bradyrhizobium brasilense TaxID=1419277 RepID=UPI001E5821F6|nr:GMC oxidoreductase [Bradyrhizobium brasilense]MCC8947512.1 GMC family oxidoreductase [Bradyrhizobium brasilense]
MTFKRRDFLAGSLTIATAGVSSSSSEGAIASPTTGAVLPDRWKDRLIHTDNLVSQKVSDSWSSIFDANKNDPFDVVIVGSGMFGGYLADKLFRMSPDESRLRVLVIEWGDYILNTHYQNMGRKLTSAIVGYPQMSKGDPLGKIRADFWNVPWVSDQDFRGLAQCVGGRSAVWAGWSPRLEDSDFSKWPSDVRDFLLTHPDGYGWVEEETGASDLTDYIAKSPLYAAIRRSLNISSRRVKDRGEPVLTRVQPAPLAVLSSSPQPGLFPFNKFSSLAFLTNAICEDRWTAGWSGGNTVTAKDAKDRKLFLLPCARVLRLKTALDGRSVESIDLDVAGEAQLRNLPLKKGAVVVLANGTIEATRLALNDLGIGGAQKQARNLMAHLRSNLTVRIKRSELRKVYPNLPSQPDSGKQEVVAFLVRGEDKKLNRRFHFQVVAASLPENIFNPGDLLWMMVPDTETLNSLLAKRDDRIAVSFNLVGEMSSQSDGGKSFVQAIPDAASDDDYKVPLAKVTLQTNGVDDELWRVMETAALKLAWEIGGGDEGDVKLDYQNSQINLTSEFIEKYDPSKTNLRDGIGTSHHEGGTLFMGADPAQSVTDPNGKFHNLENVFALGPALYPTIGSANPTLTGLALARKLAGHLLDTHGKANFVQGQISSGELVLPSSVREALGKLDPRSQLFELSKQPQFAIQESKFSELVRQARERERNSP